MSSEQRACRQVLPGSADITLATARPTADPQVTQEAAGPPSRNQTATVTGSPPPLAVRGGG